MKKNSFFRKKARAIVLILSLTMLFTSTGWSAMQKEGQVYAGDMITADNLQPGDHFYMGNNDSAWFTGIPYWRVLDVDKENKKALVVSERLWKGDGKTSNTSYPRFSQRITKTSNKWTFSNAASWCRLFYINVLESSEYVLPTTLTDSSYETVETYYDSEYHSYYSYGFASCRVNNENVFFLSAEEVEKYMPVEVSDNNVRSHSNKRAYPVVAVSEGSNPSLNYNWWLRSPAVQVTENAEDVGRVDEKGNIGYTLVTDYCSARPAFYLDLSNGIPASLDDEGDWVVGKLHTSDRFKIYPSKAKYLNQKGLRGTLLGHIFKENMIEELSGPIPGIKKTKFETLYGSLVSRKFVPQGFCKFGDYYLVTAYNEYGNWPSIVCVLDKNCSLVTTITVGDYNYHSGGIAYDPDGDVVWMCGNTDGTELIFHTVLPLRGSDVRNAINSGNTAVHIDSFISKGLLIKNKSSCLDYHDGRLWVGTFDKNYGEIIGYKTSGATVDRKNSVYLNGVLNNLNGFTFDENGDLYCSYSSGRYRKCYSQITKYEVIGKLDGKSTPSLEEIRTVPVPRMNEEIVVNDGNLYVLYESASEKYRYNAYQKTDRITSLPTSLWASAYVTNSAKNMTGDSVVELFADESRTIDFEYSYNDDGTDINQTEEDYTFVPEQSGNYSISIEDFYDYDNYVNCEVIDDTGNCISSFSTAFYDCDTEEYYEPYDTDTENCNRSLNLTAGTRYRISLTAGSINEADSFSGSYSISIKSNGSVASQSVNEGTENTVSAIAGEQACFSYEPQDDGVFEVSFDSVGELGEMLILEDMEKEIDLIDGRCSLKKGHKYYFMSALTDTYAASNNDVRFSINKIREKSLTGDRTEVASDTVITYSAPQTGKYIIKVGGNNDYSADIKVFDNNDNIIAAGSSDIVFETQKGSDYTIVTKDVSKTLILTIEPYKDNGNEDSEMGPGGTGAQGSNTRSTAGNATNSSMSAEAARQGILDPKLPKVKISKPKAAKKAATVKWKKLTKKNRKKAQRIEIWVCPNKAFGPDDTVIKTTSKKKASLKVKKLKAKKKYYIKVRTVKYVGGVKYVSKWSKVKKIKTK